MGHTTAKNIQCNSADSRKYIKGHKLHQFMIEVHTELVFHYIILPVNSY